MPIKISRQACAWYLVALIVVTLDLLSKVWVSAHLAYGEPVVFTSFFNFTLLHNHGAAFSVLAQQGGWQRWFFAALALIVSIALVIWIARVASVNKRESFALAFILGGALGNLYDRIQLGYVVDFIVVHYQEHYWPAFNLADSAITLGALVLIADMLFKKEKQVHA
ncbi:lipoprotein signal peptidase [Cellvibrio zantedeschiae]|uniref:Lipoprotein signal peptidase n=1 Tax=Cellvibrio zantedeschiae TaxID=1237077 RepID=A0ABQ3B5P9_9GAMM|nr:signal peptidase II [Cellvibrio zantedeschiae]GGY80560.1 lipoprotein signal peptidase [Cellvibrio zantedeschiae]